MFYALILCLFASVNVTNCMYVAEQLVIQDAALHVVQFDQIADANISNMLCDHYAASTMSQQAMPQTQDFQEAPAVPFVTDYNNQSAYHDRVQALSEATAQMESFSQIKSEQHAVPTDIHACAAQVVHYSANVDIGYMPHEMLVLTGEEQKTVLHIDERYDRCLNGRPIDLIHVKDSLDQVNNQRIWQNFVLQTRNSAIAQQYIEQINQALLDFCQQFEQACTFNDYRKAFDTLQEVYEMLEQLKEIKPACYVLNHAIYRALHHVELPLLDVFLGNKVQLLPRDVEQIAWAMQNHLDYVGRVFNVQAMQLPDGTLKKVIDDYNSSWWWQKAAKNIKYAAIKYGCRDFADLDKRKVAYALQLEQQKQIAQNLGAPFIKEKIDIAGLAPIWKQRYASRQNALEQAVSNSSLEERTYTLSKEIEHILRQKSIDPQLFTKLSGNKLQHLLQTEYIKMIKTAIGNEHAMAESVIQFAQLGAEYNRLGHMQQAMSAADIAWSILDHAQAIGEGAYEGSANVFDFVGHPVERSVELLCNAGKLCNNFARINMHKMQLQARIDAGDINAAFDMQQFEKQLDVLRRNIVDTLSDMPSREYIKQGVKFAVEWKFMGKLFDAYGQLLNESLQVLGSYGSIELLPGQKVPKEMLNFVWDAKTESYVIDLLHDASNVAREFQGLPIMRPSRGIIVVQDGVKFLPSPEKVAGLTHVIHEVKKVEPLDQPVQEFDPCATSNVYEGNVDSSASQVQYGSSFQSISQVKVKTLDDILSECEFLEKTRSRIKIFQKKGDYATVLQNFESLSLKGVRCIPVKGGEGKMGLLPDGRRIIARSVSTDEGCPTLEVQKSNGRIEIKIRYKDRIVSGK